MTIKPEVITATEKQNPIVGLNELEEVLGNITTYTDKLNEEVEKNTIEIDRMLKGEETEIEKDLFDLDIRTELKELVEKDALKIKGKIVKYLTNLHAKRISEYIEATYYKEEYSELKKLSLEVTLIRIFLASLDDTVLKIIKDALKD